MMIATRSSRWGVLGLSVVLCAVAAYEAMQALDTLHAEQQALKSAQTQLKNSQKASQGMLAYKIYDGDVHALMSRADAAVLLPAQWLRNPIDVKKRVMARTVAVDYLADLGNSQFTLLKLDMFDLQTVRADDDLYHILNKSGAVSLTMKGEYLTRRTQE